MKIGDEVFVHGYVDEIRKDTIIIRNDGGYFGTIRNEIRYIEGDEIIPQRVADTPQTDCIIADARLKAHCLNCAESGSYKCKRCDGEMYYKDTPQTDRTEPIECKGCTKHICYGCEHQAEKEAWRKAQADCGWK